MWLGFLTSPLMRQVPENMVMWLNLTLLSSEELQGQPSTLTRQSPMLLCMLCFWRPIIVYPFFIKINFIL